MFPGAPVAKHHDPGGSWQQEYTVSQSAGQKQSRCGHARPQALGTNPPFPLPVSVTVILGVLGLWTRHPSSASTAMWCFPCVSVSSLLTRTTVRLD